MKPFALPVVLLAALFFTHCLPENLLPGDGNGSEQLDPAQLGLLALGLQTPEETVDRPDPGPRGSPCIVKEEFSLLPQAEYFNETVSGEVLVGRVTEPISVTLGPDRPSVSVFAEHDNPWYWSGASAPIQAIWQAPDGTRFLNVESQGFFAWSSRSFLVSQIPLARNAEYAVGADVYPHYESEQIYQVQFYLPTPAYYYDPDIPVTGTAVYNCTPIPEQEKNYETDQTYDKDNGQRHVWDDHAHLNIHIIFIDGVHEFANIEDFQPAMDRMTDLFLQSSAKIHLHFTTTTVENPELQQINWDTINNESGAISGSLSYLFLNTATQQKEDAINVFITQLNECCHANGIAGGAPGPSGLTGRKNSGLAVFINMFESNESGLIHLGRVLGHEVGHMLGLQHTDYSTLPDPLIETPLCESAVTGCKGESFADAGAWNLMGDAGRITGEQAYVMRLNPLLYRR